MQSKKQHLDPEQIARCAEAINNNSYAQLPEELRMHLYECDQCAEEVISVTEIASEIADHAEPQKETDTPQVPKTLKGSKTVILFGIAAAAAIIAFTLILNIPWNDQSSIQQLDNTKKLAETEKDEVEDTLQKTNEPVNARKDKERTLTTADANKPEKKVKKTPDNKLLAYYEPNPKLERMYTNMQGGYRGETIEVITNPEMQYKKGATLEWKNPNRTTLYVEIFNNQGEEVRRKITTENSYQLPGLNPGLYYWKLIGENYDLLFVGKIIVK